MKVRCHNCNEIKEVKEEGEEQPWYTIDMDGELHKGWFFFGKFLCNEKCMEEYRTREECNL